MYPELFRIDGLTFHSFGLMAALALIVPGLLVVWPLLRRRGVSPDFAVEVIVAAGLGGFVGARVYYMAEHWSIGARGHRGEHLHRHRLHLVRRAHRRLRRRPRLDPRRAASRSGSSPTPRRPRWRWGTRSAASAASSPATATTGAPATCLGRWATPNGTVPTPPGVTVHPTPVYEILMMAPIVCVLWRLAKRAALGLVDLRLVPRALGGRALRRRVLAAQPRVGRRADAGAVGVDRRAPSSASSCPGIPGPTGRGGAGAPRHEGGGPPRRQGADGLRPDAVPPGPRRACVMPRRSDRGPLRSRGRHQQERARRLLEHGADDRRVVLGHGAAPRERDELRVQRARLPRRSSRPGRPHGRRSGAARPAGTARSAS